MPFHAFPRQLVSWNIADILPSTDLPRTQKSVCLCFSSTLTTNEALLTEGESIGNILQEIFILQMACGSCFPVFPKSWVWDALCLPHRVWRAGLTSWYIFPSACVECPRPGAPDGRPSQSTAVGPHLHLCCPRLPLWAQPPGLFWNPSNGLSGEKTNALCVPHYYHCHIFSSFLPFLARVSSTIHSPLISCVPLCLIIGLPVIVWPNYSCSTWV